MPITLITGVPGTGKTAYIVAELEKIAATGRIIFVDNIPDLKIPHYRAGKISQWQKSTWLHIDIYKRTAPAIALKGIPVAEVNEEYDEDEDHSDNENWEPNPDVVKDKEGNLRRIAYDADGRAVGTVEYESHKGALLVIDEAQRHFRPRAAGSQVPDYVAALEVHRHQGLDIWIISQRTNMIDSNVRGLAGKHIAFRSTPLGRFKYEWPEAGEIDSKSSRDTAARSRYKLPKHAFALYKSAETHTKHSHKLPLAGKMLAVALPLLLGLLWMSYKSISGKFEPVKQATAEDMPVSSGQIKFGVQPPVKQPQAVPVAPQPVTVGLEPYGNTTIEGKHPYQGVQLSIVGRIQSDTKDIYRFSAAQNGQHSFYLSSTEMKDSGYQVHAIADCSAKIKYERLEFFVTCDTTKAFEAAPRLSISPGIQPAPQIPAYPPPARQSPNYPPALVPATSM